MGPWGLSQARAHPVAAAECDMVRQEANGCRQMAVVVAASNIVELNLHANCALQASRVNPAGPAHVLA